MTTPQDLEENRKFVVAAIRVELNSRSDIDRSSWPEWMIFPAALLIDRSEVSSHVRDMFHSYFEFGRSWPEVLISDEIPESLIDVATAAVSYLDNWPRINFELCRAFAAEMLEEARRVTWMDGPLFLEQMQR